MLESLYSSAPLAITEGNYGRFVLAVVNDTYLSDDTSKLQDSDSLLTTSKCYSDVLSIELSVVDIEISRFSGNASILTVV